LARIPKVMIEMMVITVQRKRQSPRMLG